MRRGRPPPAALRPVYLAPHRLPFFRLSVGRVGVQPAAELGHVQGRIHARHVPGALRACPGPQLSVGLPMPAACAAATAPHPPASARGRTSPSIACPPFDSAEHTLVRRQQAPHPLRVGGHLGLRLRWLRLELGSRKLQVKIGSSVARAPRATLRTGGEGGEDKDEGRVGVRSDNRPKHHKRPRRRGQGRGNV